MRPSKKTAANVPSVERTLVAVSFEKATAPRLAVWPLANLMYSSPIRELNCLGTPFENVASATMYPVVPGSRSEVLKVAVWFSVRQMKESATWQFAPFTKNKSTATLHWELVLVMLMRVSAVFGFVASEV